MITYGSVCSGIEAASVAWHMLGFRASWFAEIEPFPSAVLAHRWPAVPNLGDMTKLAREVLLGIIAAPLILVGGTPCQDFSVAGMRAGLAGERGALTMKFVELADAIDHVRPDGDECVVVWENVLGVLSDKGNAFGNFLAALVGESEALEPSGPRWTNAGCVYGPRRAAAWRVLDAQYFGLAQRRKRVFVVASARADFDPAAVLLEREGLRRDHPPRRGEGQDLAGHAPFGPALQCGCGHLFDLSLGQSSEDGTGRGQPIVADVAPTLRSGNFRSHSNPATQADSLVIASAVRRLTPRECERLQGFPDDYTLIPWRGKSAEECPDGPRYKAIGNSKAVSAARGLSRRATRLALGIGPWVFREMLTLMPDIEWPAKGQSLDHKRANSQKQGYCTPALARALDQARQARKEKHTHTVRGRTGTLEELVDLLPSPVSASTVRRRLAAGMSLEDALLTPHLPPKPGHRPLQQVQP